MEDANFAKASDLFIAGMKALEHSPYLRYEDLLKAMENDEFFDFEVNELELKTVASRVLYYGRNYHCADKKLIDSIDNLVNAAMDHGGIRNESVRGALKGLMRERDRVKESG